MDLFGRKRIAQLEESLATQQRLFNIQQQGWRNMEDRYHQLIDAILFHNRALGRVIAKLDPNYGIPENDPSRVAESDRIGDAVIAKLLGEHKIQRSIPK